MCVCVCLECACLVCVLSVHIVCANLVCAPSLCLVFVCGYVCLNVVRCACRINVNLCVILGVIVVDIVSYEVVEQ